MSSNRVVSQGIPDDDLVAAIELQEILDQKTLNDKWGAIAKSPAFAQLVALVSNVIARYDKGLRNTSEPHKRLDLLQRQNGARLVMSGLDTIAEAGTNAPADIFQTSERVDERVLAGITDFAEYVEIRESWTSQLKALYNQAEKPDLSADAASAIISRTFGLHDCLSTIFQAITRGKNPNPSPSLPASSETKAYTQTQLDENARHAEAFLRGK